MRLSLYALIGSLIGRRLQTATRYNVVSMNIFWKGGLQTATRYNALIGSCSTHVTEL